MKEDGYKVRDELVKSFESVIYKITLNKLSLSFSDFTYSWSYLRYYIWRFNEWRLNDLIRID